jgi:glycosyltransferase involved in cell wall biosynthesis
MKEENDGFNIHRVTIPIPKKLNLFFTLIYYFKYLWASYKQAIDISFEVIHCHDLYTLPIGVALKLRTGKPLIYDSHEYYPGLHYPQGGFKAKLLDVIERTFLIFTDDVLTVSKSLAKRYRKYKPHIIMNCPQIHDYLESDRGIFREKFNIPEDAFILIYEGNLSNHRNLKFIVSNLASILKETIQDSHILICGTGTLENDLIRIAKSNVIFTGHLDTKELFSITRASDIGLILFERTPNNILGLPNKLFEYMSAGIPVIASDMPSISKIVKNENIGFIVDSTNPDKILHAIISLYNNPEKRKMMGKRGEAAVIERYNWDIESEKMLKVYKNLNL